MSLLSVAGKTMNVAVYLLWQSSVIVHKTGVILQLCS